MPKLGRRVDLSSSAPFGTNDTPSFRSIIIGGNVVDVVDSPANDNQDPFKGFYITDKPTNVDPGVLTDFTTRYNRPYLDPFHNRSDQIRPSYPPKRPDSKDISSRYPLLAPIDGNRIKYQQMSTVFEPEAWTKRYSKQVDSPFLAHSSGQINSHNVLRLENNDSASPHYARSQDPTSPNAGRNHQMTPDDTFKARLLSMIPSGMFLPETPLQLSQSEETRLLNLLTSELYFADPLKLRDIYLDISNRVDKQLSGYCHYQDLYHTFARVSFEFPGDLLQLVAAMFVSNHRKQRDVNYEQFLSFVGAALKNRDNIKPPRTSHSFQLNSDNPKQSTIHYPVRHRPGSPFFGDVGEVKLLRMVEEQLNENEFVLDLERLVNSFQMEDRDMRGTLSADQIKNICFQHRIPIQQSLITSLLNKCQENKMDYQYNWSDFVRLLERVQPGKTSNPVSLNKRPLELSKPLHSPAWPRDETHSNGQNSRATWNREELKSSHKKEEGSWFTNFMKFADALYRQDANFEGSLPVSEVVEWAGIYNKTFQLEIPDSEISTALSHSTRKGKVDIHKFLSLLKKQY